MYAFSSLGFLQSLVSGGFRENIHDGSSSFRKGRLRPVNSALTGSDNTQLALRGNPVSTTIHLKQRVPQEERLKSAQIWRYLEEQHVLGLIATHKTVAMTVGWPKFMPQQGPR